ncbi:MAG: GAF domain-containing protein [Deltaproteobacteria bacterium]|nr:GAF domain-containing protein [Deltaproteobacteria bacterium]
MSEGIHLESLPRGTWLAPSARIARLTQAIPQIEAVLAGETDTVLIQATLACLLWDTMVWCNWVGFYRRVSDTMLSVGPYQGGMGCLHIALDRGVCGAAARTGQTQRVPDVHAFAGHIACDDKTQSELVVPVVYQGHVRAVLDLDSPHRDAFSEDEAKLIEELVARIFSDQTTLQW